MINQASVDLSQCTGGGGQLGGGAEGGVMGRCPKQIHAPVALGKPCTDSGVRQRGRKKVRETSIEEVRLRVQPVCLSNVLRMTWFSASTQLAKPSVWSCSPRPCFSLYIILATPSTSSFLSAISLARTLCVQTSKMLLRLWVCMLIARVITFFVMKMRPVI